jgi:hypothetical protein
VTRTPITVTLAPQVTTNDKLVEDAAQIAPISIQLLGQSLASGPSFTGFRVEVFRDEQHRNG